MGKGKGTIAGWFGNIRAGYFILEFNYTKFKDMRRLFEYLVKKFTGRVQGVIRPTWRELPGLRAGSGSTAYFQTKDF